MGTSRTVRVGACSVWEEAEQAVLNLEKRRLWGSSLHLWGGYWEHWVRRFTESYSKKITGNSQKLRQVKFQLSLMTIFSLLGQPDIWAGPRGVGESPSLEVLNTCLDKPQAAFSEFGADPAWSSWSRNLLSSFQPQWVCVQHGELQSRTLRSTLLTNSCA